MQRDPCRGAADCAAGGAAGLAGGAGVRWAELVRGAGGVDVWEGVAGAAAEYGEFGGEGEAVGRLEGDGGEVGG